MRFDILTIFPQLLSSPLQEGIIRRAIESGRVSIGIENIRDYALDRHAMTDDRPFGGGEGMVMKPEPLAAAIRSVKQRFGTGRVILLSPQGQRYEQGVVRHLATEEHLILICGRYEGIDERIRATLVDEEISIGDFILTGGELAAMVVVDSVVRMLPGVLGCADSAANDTFSHGRLKHPQYTRPRNFEGFEVPEVLLSGDHAAVAQWRLLASVTQTLANRPDLLDPEQFSREERRLLRKHGLWSKIERAAENRVAMKGPSGHE
ncbi:MAG: tRNA (guanosine(37)-N1)-methyltransferase TrmD [Deltaproteobacteria bacterium]